VEYITYKLNVSISVLQMAIITFTNVIVVHLNPINRG